MSAILCGKRSSFFEDLPSSPPVSKRIRCSSSNSPVKLSSRSSLLDHLASLFPDMDKQLLERALEECGDDLDLTIRSLEELRLGSNMNLGSTAGMSSTADDANVNYQTQGIATTNGEFADPSTSQNLPIDGAEWVELFVREMVNASNMDDARARATRALEELEKSICARTTAEVSQSFHQENAMLKEHLRALLNENMILKRAVSIQHERHKEFDDRSQELVQLKQLVVEYKEKLKTLEVNNYALTVHLNRAQESSSIPGRFHPDIF